MGFVFRLIRAVGLRLLAPVLVVGAGWLGGAKYGAPELLINTTDGAIARVQSMAAPLLIRGGEVAAEAAEQSSGYVVGTVEQMLDDLAEDTNDAPEKTNQPAPEPASVAATGDIVLCPNMRVSNHPRADANGLVRPAGATVHYKGVELLLMPATNSCLSSGYGDRNGRLHKGVDYHTKISGDVLAAGDGVIVEAVSRADYGNMIVIDHGGGVYTRYAHLARINGGIKEGARVSQGQVLGPIGMTGQSSVLHLHWEVLTGDIDTNAGSFGLQPIVPFSL